MSAPEVRDKRYVRGVAVGGWAMLLAAACSAVLSQVDPEPVRDVVRRLVALGWIWPSEAGLPALFRTWAIGAAVSGAGVLALRRSLGRVLGGARCGDRGREGGRTEVVVAVAVVGAGAALAARSLPAPMGLDEATTLVDYASGSFWHAWSAYETPNNHVLHTLLVWAAHRAWGWDLAALRMPAFGAGCLALAAAWWFVRREHGWPAAAFATGLLGTSPLFVEYASNARGYSLLLLLSVLALGAGREAARRPEARGWWAAWAAAVGLGFFAVPLMAFAASASGCWMLLSSWRSRGAASLPGFGLRLAGWSAAALGLAAALYAPVLASSGAEALLANPYIDSLQWSNWSTNWGRRFVARHTAGTWLQWHWATPAWAQAGLLAAIGVGAWAPVRRGAGGGRGLFAAALALGTGLVLAAKPVLLDPRMTLFHLFGSMALAGAGLAALCEAALGRVAGSGSRLAGPARAGSAALVVGLFGWWATRPGVAERRDIPLAHLPEAVAAVVPQLRPGDYVVGDWRKVLSVAVIVKAAGRDVTPTRVGTFLSTAGVYSRRIKGGGMDDAVRTFVFVADSIKLQLLPLRFRRETMKMESFGSSRPAGVQQVACLLERSGFEYSVVADVPGWRVFRLLDYRPDEFGPQLTDRERWMRRWEPCAGRKSTTSAAQRSS